MNASFLQPSARKDYDAAALHGTAARQAVLTSPSVWLAAAWPKRLYGLSCRRLLTGRTRPNCCCAVIITVSHVMFWPPRTPA